MLLPFTRINSKLVVQQVNRLTSSFAPMEIGYILVLANDLAIENNRYMSSSHCIFEFNQGHVSIRDTSSNGTLINRTKKIHRNDTVGKHLCRFFSFEIKSKMIHSSLLNFNRAILFTLSFEKMNPDQVSCIGYRVQDIEEYLDVIYQLDLPPVKTKSIHTTYQKLKRKISGNSTFFFLDEFQRIFLFCRKSGSIGQH